MRFRLRFLILPLLAFLLAACGDSQEKLMEDQLDYMEEITGIVRKVADGSLSSSEGAEKIREWGKKGEELQKRKAGLDKQLTADELEALTRKYEKRAMTAASEMLSAMSELQRSGRMTEELGEALMNVKN